MKKQNHKVQKLVIIAAMGSLSIILAKTIKFPIFPTAPFLKMDFGEIPLLICNAIFPLQGGIAALLVKELLSFFVFGTNIFGLAADFAACGIFLVTFSFIAGTHPDKKRSIAAFSIGALARMIGSVPINFIILPLQYGSTIQIIMGQLIYIIPFNGLKCLLDGVFFLLAYKQIYSALSNSYSVMEK